MAETAKVSFEDAFQAAKAEHMPAEAEPAEEPLGAEQEGETKAEEQETPPPAEETEKAADQPDETAEPLLSDEEVGKLSKGQQETYKRMQKAYTQKTQKLAAERKEIQKYRDLIDDFNSNPQDTLRKLAQQCGMELADKKQAETKEMADDVASRHIQMLKEALGPDGEVLAERMGPVLVSLARSIAEDVSKKQIAPIEQQQQQQTAEAVAKEVDGELAAFGAKEQFKDWKQYEPKMLELSKKFQPAEGEMSAQEYLESLYYLATRGRSEAKKTNEVVERINKAAKASQEKPATVSEKVVAVAPGRKLSFKEAFEMAKRGERVE